MEKLIIFIDEETISAEELQEEDAYEPSNEGVQRKDC